jgi:hypothetical protein
MSCCGTGWVGVDRAHCCRRTGGCGHVFDDALLWDAHRPVRMCVDPRSLGLVQTTNGVWLRALDPVPTDSRPAATNKTPRLRGQPGSGNRICGSFIPGLEPAPEPSQHVGDGTSRTSSHSSPSCRE